MPAVLRPIVACLVAGALVTGLAACGGDEGPTKEEWISKADALCADANTEAETLTAEAFENPENPTGEEAQEFVTKAADLTRELTREIRALEQPEDEEERIEAILTAAEAATKEYEETGQDPDASLLLVTGEAPDPAETADRRAREFGMKDCAE